MKRVLAILVVALATSGLRAQNIQVDTTDGNSSSGKIVGLYREGLRYLSGGVETDLPWAKIMTLRSDGEALMTFGEDERVKVRVSGIQDGWLVVSSDMLGSMRIETGSLPAAPAPAKAKAEKTGPLEPKDWNGHLAFNLGLTSGNSETFLAAVDALAQTQSSHDSYMIRFSAVYGKSEGEENANAQSLRGGWQHYYHEHLYTYLRGEVFRDRIQRIDFGALLDVGVGWVVWKESDDESFALEGGIGYRHETYEDDTESRNDITARGAVVYQDIFFEKVDFFFTAEMLVPMNEPSAWLGRAELNWSIPVSDNWAFDNTVRFQYRNQPARDAESYDLFVGAGLKYSF
ncbi:MAG: DUF481 domain-containing protein [Planctomycetes bacterium]|nr:DUF481 domain-containing protein [Planctomycetota bacterium]